MTGHLCRDSHAAVRLGQYLFPLFALALDLPKDFFADKVSPDIFCYCTYKRIVLAWTDNKASGDYAPAILSTSNGHS